MYWGTGIVPHLMLSCAAFQVLRLSSWFLSMIATGFLRFSEVHRVCPCTCPVRWPERGWDTGLVGHTGVKVTQYKEKRKILRMIVQLLSFTSTELCRDLLSCATSRWNWFLYLTLFGKGIKEQKVQLCAGQKTGFSLPSLLLFVMWNVFCPLLQVELCVESWSQVLLM